MSLLNLLFPAPLPKGQFVEVRAIDQLKPKHSADKVRATTFRNVDGAISWAQQQATQGYDAYFGVATRTSRQGGTKADVGPTNALWVDYDRTDLEVAFRRFVLRPTVVVYSGVNYHLYFLLKDPLADTAKLERHLKMLAQIMGADPAAAEAARILRVPDTLNYKTRPPSPVKIVQHLPPLVYNIEDFAVAFKTNTELLGFIEDGKTLPDKSRSERDWLVVSALVKAGASDLLIKQVFATHTLIADKVGEAGAKYLDHTIRRAREHFATQTVLPKIVPATGPAEVVQAAEIVFEEAEAEETPATNQDQPMQTPGFEVFAEYQMGIGPDGYYSVSRKGEFVRISSFVFQPQALCREERKPDKYLGTIVAGGAVYPDIELASSDFASARDLRDALVKAEFSWLGNDKQTAALKQIIFQKWQELEGPGTLITLTSLLGRQLLRAPDGTFVDTVVASDRVLFPQGVERNDIRYSPPAKLEPLTINVGAELLSSAEVAQMLQKVLKANTENVIKPMLGWWAMTAYKPVLERNNCRFPHLLVTGTRGAGKTTLITQVFQPLFGYPHAQTFLSGTTVFVIHRLLGSTTSFPVCFSEFRHSTLRDSDRFMQTMRAAYDSGKDARGYKDLSIEEFPLHAPICVDGEEEFSDPAMLERVIQVRLLPEITRIPAHQRGLREATSLDLARFAPTWYSWALSNDVMPTFLRRREKLLRKYTTQLPPRVLHNLAIVETGLDMLERFTGLQLVADKSFEEKVVDTVTLFDVVDNAQDPEFDEAEHTVAVPEWFAAQQRDIVPAQLGRTLLAIDTFVVDLVTKFVEDQAIGFQSFIARYLAEKDVFVFQFAGAYTWWRQSRARQLREQIDDRALRKQLDERLISAKNEKDTRGLYFLGWERMHLPGVGTVPVMKISLAHLEASGFEFPRPGAANVLGNQTWAVGSDKVLRVSSQ